MPDLEAPQPAGPELDFTLPAELYVGHGNRRRQGLTYTSFPTLADAVRHVVETPHPAGEVATIECGETRLGMRQIAELYNDARYPLPRRRTVEPNVDATGPREDTEIKSIAIPVTRRMPAARSAPPSDKPMPRSTPAELAAAQIANAPSRAVHRFKVGARLRMKQGGNSVARPASFCRVVFLLPFEGSQLLYRVKSETESFERVVAEADLAPA